MRATSVLFAAFVFVAGHVFAQAAPRAPEAPRASQTPRTAQTPAPPAPAAPAAPAASAPPPPPPPAPPGPPRREGQPINVKVELNITEEGGSGAPVKKTVSAVVADGFNGFVREQGFATSTNMPPRMVPLNLDAFPTILPSGKIRLTCSIQYNAGTSSPSVQTDQRSGTEIRQNLVLILESGRSLVISQATDPVSDRRVTVEVTATILR